MRKIVLLMVLFGCEPSAKPCQYVDSSDCSYPSEYCSTHKTCDPNRGCVANADCAGWAAGSLCDPNSKFCVECVVTDDCAGGIGCIDNHCQ